MAGRQFAVSREEDEVNQRRKRISEEQRRFEHPLAAREHGGTASLAGVRHRPTACRREGVVPRGRDADDRARRGRRRPSGRTRVLQPDFEGIPSIC